MRRAANRDIAEADIVDALTAVGCSVTRLDGAGLPDLLVGRLGKTYLLEVKTPQRKDGRAWKRKGSELTPAQVRWHSMWRGATPVIVHTMQEALVAVGARVA